MKRQLKYFISCGLGAVLLAALAVILAACSSTPTTSASLSTQAPGTSAPPSLQAPATTATSPNSTQTAPPTAPNLPQRQGVNGTISNINGNILTLTTQQGVVTINISPNTNIQKTVSGTLSDLQVGQSLSATGNPDASGNVSATSIMIRPQNQGFPTPPAGTNPNPSGRPRPSSSASPRIPNSGGVRGAFGTLSNINGNTLILTTPQGSVTVNLTSNTIIQKTVSCTISELQNGQSLAVTGSRDANGNVNASSISIMPQRALSSPTGT